MTQIHRFPGDTDRSSATCFLPLFLCFALGAVAAFFLGGTASAATYAVDLSLPRDSLLHGLTALVRCLRGALWQTVLVFLSAFVMSPALVVVPIVLYRGLCLGLTLYAVRMGQITGAASPEAAVVLYFAGTVLLLLAACMAERCHRGLRSVGMRKPGCYALLFAYIRSTLVVAGGIFAVSAFAILFC